MRTILVLSIGLFVSCVHPRTPKENKIIADIESYLPAGQHEAEIVELRKSPRAEELSKKFYAAIEKNSDWFSEEAEKAKELDRVIPYDKRLGLTEKEYEEFVELSMYGGINEYVKSATETITISHSNNKITFQSAGQLAILNKVTFDLTESIVGIGKYKLDMVDTLNVTDNKNGFKSPWKGYRWRFKTTKGKEQLDPYLRLVSVTVGKLERTKKTYVRVHTIDLTETNPIDSQIQFEL